ncbi:MAG: TRAP transporter large permease subunit [Bacillota bacterium]
MEWWIVILIFFGVLITLLLLEVPVAFAIFIINIFGAFIFFKGLPGLRQLNLSIYDTLTTFTLTPVPLFILMGEALFRSGAALRALEVLDEWIGKMPGRLGVLTTLGGTLFAVLSGSTMANTAMMGTLLLPQMQKRGYHDSISMGSILASGGLAMIIPPSALAIIFGTIARISIGKLLIAGIIPGLIMALNYAFNIIIRCTLNPSLAPSYEIEPVPFRQKMVALVRDVLPFGIIIFLVLGLLFFGVATPTESAALGAIGSLILVACYGQLNLKLLKEMLLGTLKVTVMIFFIMMGAQIFSQIMAFSGAINGLVNIFLSLRVPPLVLLIIIQIILLFMGMFLEQVSIMLVTLPFFMPIVTQMGWDPLWFAILMLINLQIAHTTPPFGLLLFVMKGVAPPGTTMLQIYKSALPFVVSDLITIAILVTFPVLVLWLPGLM